LRLRRRTTGVRVASWAGLREDFSLPALCAVNAQSGGGVRHVNAWLGPAGTVTPLHFDSYDNILTQVVGYKRIRLYEVRETELNLAYATTRKQSSRQPQTPRRVP